MPTIFDIDSPARTNALTSVVEQMSYKVSKFAEFYNKNRRTGKNINVVFDDDTKEYVFTNINDYDATLFAKTIATLAPVQRNGYLKLIQIEGHYPRPLPDNVQVKVNDKKNKTVTLSIEGEESVTYEGYRFAFFEYQWGKPKEFTHLECWQGKIDPFNPEEEIRYSEDEMKAVIRQILVDSYEIA